MTQVQTHPTRRRIRRAPFFLTASAGVLLAALAVAGCGGSSSASPGSTEVSPASAGGKVAETALKFSKCMREHGVTNFPNPEISGGHVGLKIKQGGPGGLGANQQTMEAAQNACKHFQEGLAPKLTPQEKVEREEAVMKFAKCMREHGIDVHGETSGGNIRIGIHGGPGSGGPNPESPAFQAAQKACQGLLPFKGGGPGQAGAPTKAPPSASSGGGGQNKPGLSVGG
jgi:hypothetical protein